MPGASSRSEGAAPRATEGITIVTRDAPPTPGAPLPRAPSPPGPSPRILGRYALYDEIAAGGMATVHVGRMRGPAGFARTVAIKRLHPQFAKDPEFVSMFLDEARLAARIRHPNVVSVIDVVATEGELFLVMDYVDGCSLLALLRGAARRGQRLPIPIAASIVTQGLAGLHAAHVARDETGEPLGIVHRDVSPHNFLVGADGTTSLIDFGVAKAARRVHVTREGVFKGKLAYVAPEQLVRKVADVRSDIYAAGLVFWEMLVGRRCFSSDEAELIYDVLAASIDPPSLHNPAVPPELDAIVLRAVSRDPGQRYQTAHEMAAAIERVVAPATPREVGAFVRDLEGESLEARAESVATVEKQESSADPPPDTAFELAGDTLQPPRMAPARTVETSLESVSRRRRRSYGWWIASVAFLASGFVAFALTQGRPASASMTLARPVERAVLRLRSAVGASVGAAPVASPTASSVPSAASVPSQRPRANGGRARDETTKYGF